MCKFHKVGCTVDKNSKRPIRYVNFKSVSVTTCSSIHNNLCTKYINKNKQGKNTRQNTFINCLYLEVNKKSPFLTYCVRLRAGLSETRGRCGNMLRRSCRLRK